MTFAKEDEVRVRRLLHAHAMTQGLQGDDAAAEGVLGRPALEAVDVLRAASADLAAEKADDAPARASRDRASGALATAIQGVVRLLRARSSAAALGPDGEIATPEPLEAADALVHEFFPGGRPSNLPRGGAGLQAVGERLAQGLRRLDYNDLAAKLDGPLQDHAAALDRLALEADELGAAQLALVKARAEVDRLLRAGEAYLAYKIEVDRSLGLTVDEVFPRVARHTPDQEADALDEAGVDPLEDEDDGDDDTMDSADDA